MRNETEVIKVALRACHSEFDTVGAAIVGVKQQPTCKTSVAASAENTGTTIEGIEWTDTSATFRLSNSNFIRIWCEGDSVSWGVYAHTQQPWCKESHARQLLLEFPNEAEPAPWSRAELLERRLNRPFVSVLETDFGVFLYAQGCLALLFRSLASTQDNEPLLYWDETD